MGVISASSRSFNNIFLLDTFHDVGGMTGEAHPSLKANSPGEERSSRAAVQELVIVEHSSVIAQGNLLRSPGMVWHGLVEFCGM